MVANAATEIRGSQDRMKCGQTPSTQLLYRAHTRDLIKQLDRILPLPLMSTQYSTGKRRRRKRSVATPRTKNVILKELCELLTKIQRDDESLRLVSKDVDIHVLQPENDEIKGVDNLDKPIACCIPLAALDAVREEDGLGGAPEGMSTHSFAAVHQMTPTTSVPADVSSPFVEGGFVIPNLKTTSKPRSEMLFCPQITPISMRYIAWMIANNINMLTGLPNGPSGFQQQRFLLVAPNLQNQGCT